MTLEQALRALNMEPHELDAETVRNRHRRLAETAHPDRGGSDAVMADLNEAKEVALSWIPKVEEARANPVCVRCDGTGVIRVVRGFQSMNMSCPSCTTVVPSKGEAT